MPRWHPVGCQWENLLKITRGSHGNCKSRKAHERKEVKFYVRKYDRICAANNRVEFIITFPICGNVKQYFNDIEENPSKESITCFKALLSSVLWTALGPSCCFIMDGFLMTLSSWRTITCSDLPKQSSPSGCYFTFDWRFERLILILYALWAFSIRHLGRHTHWFCILLAFLATGSLVYNRFCSVCSLLCWDVIKFPHHLFYDFIH